MLRRSAPIADKPSNLLVFWPSATLHRAGDLFLPIASRAEIMASSSRWAAASLAASLAARAAGLEGWPVQGDAATQASAAGWICRSCLGVFTYHVTLFGSMATNRV